MDQIARLENEIRLSLYNRKYTIAIFFDLSHAYDGVWHLGALSELARIGVRGRLLRWIREYLSGRKYRVFNEGQYSETYSMSSGVPQGSILSPTLFNVMLSSIPHAQHVKVAEYADDILIFCSHSNVNYLSKMIQDQVIKDDTRPSKLSVSFSPQMGIQTEHNKN